VIPADVAFRQTANAAAAAFAHAPPYLAYRTEVVVDVPSIRRHKVIARQVETRTADDYAALQDLPRGQYQYAHSFPFIPTFDALSYFHIEFNGLQRDALSYVEQVQPITFTDPRATSHADLVIISLKYYHAAYGDDTTDALAHIVMDPLPTLTTNNTSTYYLHDVYVDTATNLPTRIVYEGPDAHLTWDYTVVDGHWLVRHAILTQTVHGWLHIGQVTFTAEATNSDFHFPDPPSDPHLIAPPTPAPAATPTPR
jgi:hypothetical protein